MTRQLFLKTKKAHIFFLTSASFSKKKKKKKTGRGPGLYPGQALPAAQDEGLRRQAPRQRPAVGPDPRPGHPRPQRVQALRRRDEVECFPQRPDGTPLRRPALARGLAPSRFHAPERVELVAGAATERDRRGGAGDRRDLAGHERGKKREMVFFFLFFLF